MIFTIFRFYFRAFLDTFCPYSWSHWHWWKTCTCFSYRASTSNVFSFVVHVSSCATYRSLICRCCFFFFSFLTGCDQLHHPQGPQVQSSDGHLSPVARPAPGLRPQLQDQGRRRYVRGRHGRCGGQAQQSWADRQRHWCLGGWVLWNVNEIERGTSLRCGVLCDHPSVQWACVRPTSSLFPRDPVFPVTSSPACIRMALKTIARSCLSVVFLWLIGLIVLCYNVCSIDWLIDWSIDRLIDCLQELE